MFFSEKGSWYEWEVFGGLCTYWLLYIIFRLQPHTLAQKIGCCLFFFIIISLITYGYHRKLEESFGAKKSRIFILPLFLLIPILFVFYLL